MSEHNNLENPPQDIDEPNVEKHEEHQLDSEDADYHSEILSEENSVQEVDEKTTFNRFADISPESLAFSMICPVSHGTIGQLMRYLQELRKNMTETPNRVSERLVPIITEILDEYDELFINSTSGEQLFVFGRMLNGYRNDGLVSRPITLRGMQDVDTYKQLRFGSFLKVLRQRLMFILGLSIENLTRLLHRDRNRENAFTTLQEKCRDFMRDVVDTGTQTSVVCRWQEICQDLRSQDEQDGRQSRPSFVPSSLMRLPQPKRFVNARTNVSRFNHYENRRPNFSQHVDRRYMPLRRQNVPSYRSNSPSSRRNFVPRYSRPTDIKFMNPRNIQYNHHQFPERNEQERGRNYERNYDPRENNQYGSGSGLRRRRLQYE